MASHLCSEPLCGYRPGNWPCHLSGGIILGMTSECPWGNNEGRKGKGPKSGKCLLFIDLVL